MGRTDRSKEGTRRNPNEGTSARTRAFSFEDIMSRRRKKQNSNTNDKDIEMKEPFVSANNTMDHPSPDHHQIMRALKNSVKESSKKEESTSRGDGDLLKRRDTDAHDLDVITKMKPFHRKSNKDKESTDEKYRYCPSKTGYFHANESEKSSTRKRLKYFEEKDEHNEHYRKSKRDRKSDSHIDDRYRTENAKKSKKHDSVKLRDANYSEWNGHKDYHIEPFYEDTRLRRRSRSLQYDLERGRSASLSPLSRKHVYQLQEYEESYKGYSRKKHSDGDRYNTTGDVDRYKTARESDKYKVLGDGDRYKTTGDGDRFKTSGDGGYPSGHHRKHGSGLGGYSPRKRKSDAAVKTPSPTTRSPEKKIATWDQLPSETNITSTGSIFTSFPLASSKVVEAASSIATPQPTTRTHPLTSINSVSIVMNASLESVQLTQATRPMRRLYIENLPSSASEKSVIDHLNEILVSSVANHIQTKPCISCIINKDKAQALVEFLTPEDATAALYLDGNSLFGSILKMRRPKDFIEAVSGVSQKSADAVQRVSDVVMDSPHKIFVGGISGILSSKMFIEIASSFGPLKAYYYEFSKELNGLCAFLEYEDHSITSKACAVLDGLMLGGCILTAVRASLEIDGKDDASHLSYAVPPHAKPLLAEVSPVIRLQNVVNPDDLPTLPKNELEETLEDIRLECARFGTVKAVHLVRHMNSANEPKAEASEPSDSVNASAGLEPSAQLHIESKEKFDEMHHMEITESTSNYIELTKEHEMQEATGPLLHLQDIDNSSNVQTEEICNEEDNTLFEIPARKEVQDTKLAEHTIIDTVSVDDGKGKEDGQRKLVEEIDVKGSGELQACVSDVFVPGCVLVEFQRKGAACSAAHCLHGRSYSDQIVEVEYIPYNLYLKRFPK